MQHKIPLEKFGAQGQAMANAVEACVHCGFCLPTCPTYRVLGEEMDSPRGRIVLMKEVLEGNLEMSDASVHIDRCLGCLACVTACPSGVQYGELLAPFRALSEQTAPKLELRSLTKTLISSTLPYPSRFRLAASLGRFGKPFKNILPKPLKAMLELVPDVLPGVYELPDFVPATGKLIVGEWNP